jgi:tetratricopeptide (TPR) repeat protein
MGIGAWAIRLGRRLGSEGLAGMGARWVRAAMERAPQLGESILGRQAAAMRELLRQFRRGDVDEALRRALPFGEEPGRGSKPTGGSELPSHGLAYDLSSLLGRGPRGASDVWLGNDDVKSELRKEYHKAAVAAVARGDHRRAAAIYGKLLGDYRSAAQALLRGGLYRDAAAIFLARLDDPRAAAGALVSAGDLDRAIALYRRAGEHERAGDLLARIGEDDAAVVEYRIAAERLAATSGGHLAAGDLLRKKLGSNDLAMQYFRAGWERRPEDNAVSCACRLAAIHTDAGDMESLFRLIDEADALFHSGNDIPLASRFYNQMVTLVEGQATLAEVDRDAVRDRALLGLSAQARQVASGGTRATEAVRALFTPGGHWPVAMIDDAEFAVKAERARAVARRKPVHLVDIGPSTVRAVGFAPGTEEIFIGAASGHITRFRPATGEVEWLASEGPAVTSIATTLDGEVVVVLGDLPGGSRVLSTYARGVYARYLRVLETTEGIHSETCWLAPNLIRRAGGSLVGLWDGATMVVLESMTLLTRDRIPIDTADDEPTVGFLVGGDGVRGEACVAYAADRWTMAESGGRLGSTSIPMPRPLIPPFRLRFLALAPTWLNPTDVELAYADVSGAVVRASMRIDGSLFESLGSMSSPAGDYIAAAIVGRDAVAGVAQGRIDWFRAGTSRLTLTRSAACQLPMPVACFHCPRASSLVVIDKAGRIEAFHDAH